MRELSIFKKSGHDQYVPVNSVSYRFDRLNHMTGIGILEYNSLIETRMDEYYWSL